MVAFQEATHDLVEQVVVVKKTSAQNVQNPNGILERMNCRWGIHTSMAELQDC